MFTVVVVSSSISLSDSADVPSASSATSVEHIFENSRTFGEMFPSIDWRTESRSMDNVSIGSGSANLFTGVVGVLWSCVNSSDWSW